jgi:D-alanine-D-alanine ligase
LGEIVPSHEFYDYEAKYVDEKGAELLIPAKLSSETTNYISSMAVKAYRALECEGMARIDFFVTKDSPAGVFLNEVNTIPGFTPISMFPRLWEASGVTYAELLEELIALAFQRHAEKDRLRLDYSVK